MPFNSTGEANPVTRNLLIALAGVIGILFLTIIFLAGMIAGRGGDEETASITTPTPAALAGETARETPASSPGRTVQEDGTAVSNASRDAQTATPARLQARSKTEHSTCLFRTYRALQLDLADARFRPWTGYSEERVWETIQHRSTDYVSSHCRDLAPKPSTYSSTCVPRELQSFYRRHVPEGSSGPMREIAGEYALTVCQPSATR